MKNIAPANSVNLYERAYGSESPLPGFKSDRREAVCPSNHQISRPLTPSSAEKYNRSPMTLSPVGRELLNCQSVVKFGLMSAARDALVPSYFHNSIPWVPSSALKYRAPSKIVSSWGPRGLPGPGAISATIVACEPL